MFSKEDWIELGRRLDIAYGVALNPVSVHTLDEYERMNGIRLPTSYREYCIVFGPGDFEGHGQFKMSVPGYSGICEWYSLDRLNRLTKADFNFQKSIATSERFREGLLFCVDEDGAFYFFDLKEATELPPGCEYAVYSIGRDYVIRRMSNDFWQFVREQCLGVDPETTNTSGMRGRRLFQRPKQRRFPTSIDMHTATGRFQMSVVAALLRQSRLAELVGDSPWSGGRV